MNLEEHNNLRKQKDCENKKETKDFLERLENHNRSLDYRHGYDDCRKEYEEKLRWIPIYEPPKTAELVIVDSDNDLHACVAVAFIENGIWKYANGQTLWFTPRRWRRFL